MNQFSTLKLSQVTHSTRDAVVLTFDVPTELQKTFAFKAGQYVTLRATLSVDDALQDIRRPYSICSPEGGALRVAIKRMDDGLFSNWAHATLQVGSSIEVMPPQGNFGQLKLSSQKIHYLGIAAGSGITPILSILQTTLQAHPQNKFTLIFGNRATSSVMFRQELAELKDQYLERLNIVYIMSREPQDMDLLHGRLDEDKCQALFKSWLDVKAFDAAFVCGPQSMIEAATKSLLAHGMALEAIKVERFVSASIDKSKRRSSLAGQSAQGVDSGAAQCQVTMVMDGATRHFKVERGAQALLDAGLAAGIDMRHSCKGGVCSTCRAKVTQGEVEMDVNYALEDYEVKRGFVLTCQSYAVTDHVTIDFDQDT